MQRLWPGRRPIRELSSNRCVLQFEMWDQYIVTSWPAFPLQGRYTTAIWYTKAEADVLLTGPQQKTKDLSKNELRKSWQNDYLSYTILLSLSLVRLGCLRFDSTAFSSSDLLFMSSTIKTGIKITNLISAAEVYSFHIHQHPSASTIKTKYLRKTKNEQGKLGIAPKCWHTSQNIFPLSWATDTVGFTRPIFVIWPLCGKTSHNISILKLR